MTNPSVFSDSQESALLGDEEYDEIAKEMGGTSLTTLQKELLGEKEIPEEKYHVDLHEFAGYNILSQGKKIIKQEEDHYYLLPDPAIRLDDTFPGQLNFQYTIGDGGTGQDWVYSETMDKVFIKMEKTLPLRFTWEPSMEGLYLRTAMVFKLEQYRSDPVKRCHNHMASTNIANQNMDPRRIKHVVHCVNHSSSIYEERNEHLSILTPFCTPEPGSQYVPMCFKFFCKNSCPSGMNRRPTELIFTLEDSKMVVLGRRKLTVRICSCPKRDKQKDEAELTPLRSKKRKLSVAGKLSSHDIHVYKVEMDIAGKENYLSVLKYAYDVMAGQAARTGQFEFFKPYMENILHKTP